MTVKWKSVATLRNTLHKTPRCEGWEGMYKVDAGAGVNYSVCKRPKTKKAN